MTPTFQQEIPLEMIDELKDKLARLSTTAERLQSILRVVNMGVMLHGPDTEVLVCNETALKMLGVEEHELVGHRISSFEQVVVNRQGSRIYPKDFPIGEVLEFKKSVHNVLMGFVRPKSEDISWLSVNNDLVVEDDGSVRYVISSMIDISEQVRTENELKSSEDKWQFVLEGNGDGVWDWDIKHNIVFCSLSYLEMLGYAQDEFSQPGDWESNLHPDDRHHVIKTLNDHVTGENLNPYSIEYRIKCKDQGYKWILGRGKVMSRDEYGIGTRMIGTHMDISVSKRAEELLRRSLHEKEILLSEIHHRVKNNMAVISGLLSLQEVYFEEEQSRALFLESQNRIKSMALIHEKLYQSDNFTQIGFEAYIRDLIDNIKRSYGTTNKTISIRTEIVDGYLDLNNAVPCALIMNELLSNVYKHAFSNRSKGEVLIRFIHEEDEYRMEVADNGVGADQARMRKSGSLGYTLIDALVKQLRGRMEVISGSDGTRVKICFQAKLEAQTGARMLAS